MGSDHTIKLLTSINGTLVAILQNMQPASQEDKDKETIQKIHKGTASGVTDKTPSAPSASTTIKTGNINVQDITKFLNGIPASIKAVSGLNGKTIKSFELVMASISEILSSYSENTKNVKGLDNIEKISKSIQTLGETNLKKMMMSFVVIDKMHGTRHMKAVLKGMVDALKPLRRINVTDLHKLSVLNRSTKTMNAFALGMAVVVGSVVVLAIAIKALGGGEILKALGTTALIMVALSGIAIGVGVLSKFVAKEAVTSLGPLVAFIGGMQLLVLTSLAVGLIAQESFKDIMRGVGVTTIVIASYMIVIGVTSLVAKEAIPMAKNIGTLIGMCAMMSLVVLTTLMTGLIAEVAWPEILIGFGTISGMMLAYAGLNKLISTTAKGSIDTPIQLMKIMAVPMMAMVLVAGSALVGRLIREDSEDIFYGLLTTGAIVGAIALFAKTTSKEVKVAKVESSVKDIALLGLLAGETLLLVLGLVKVSDKVKEADPGALIATCAMTGGMMLALVGLAKTAQSLEKTARKGIVSMALIELLALGCVLMVGKMAKVASAASEVGWDNMFITLGAMASVVVAFGAIATAAGALAEFLIPGALALGMVELVAAGSILLIDRMVTLTQRVHELGPDTKSAWGEVSATLAAMNIVVVDFGLLCTAALAASIVMVPGAVALGIVDAVAIKSATMLDSVITVAGKIDNDTNDKIDNFVDSFDHTVKSLGGMFDLKFIKNVAKITAARPLIMPVAGVMSYVTKMLSEIAMISGPNGMIRAAKLSDQKAIYGEYVDIKASTTNIAEALASFVTIMSGAFENVKITTFIKMGIGMKVIGQIMEPVSLFANTMLGFQEGAEGTIHAVRFTDNGEIITGPDVNVEAVANSIAKSINSFCSVLFSEENTEMWTRMIAGTETITTYTGFLGLKVGTETVPGTAQQAMGVFAMMVEPVSHFAQTLAMFGTDGDTITIPEYDQDGKSTGGRKINVVAVATAISTAMTTFVEKLVEKQDLWNKLLNGLGSTKVIDATHTFRADEYHMENNMEKAMGIFANLINPVVSFAEMISKFDGDGKTLKMIGPDGKLRTVNMVDIATSLGGAVSAYVEKLTSVFVSQGENMQKITAYQQNIQGVLESFSKLIIDVSGVNEVNIADIATGSGALLDVFITRRGEIDGMVDTITILNSVSSWLSTMSTLKADRIRELTDAAESFTSILKSFDNIGETLKNVEDAVTSHSSRIGTQLSAIAKAYEDSTLTNKFTKTMVTVKTSVVDFDKVLSDGNSKRVGNIKNLTSALRELSQTSDEVKENLKLVRDIFSSLNDTKPENIDGVLDKIAQKLRVSVQHNGLNLSEEDIENAVRSALESLADIQLSGTYKMPADDMSEGSITMEVNI